jgi:DNA polymerase-3 subunit epsilon
MTRRRLARLARALGRLLEPRVMPHYDFAYLDRLSPERQAAVAAQPLADLDVVVLDTETTGLSPRAGDRVVALAAVRVRRGAVRRDEVFETLVRPDRAIPASATRIHGITDAMVAGAPSLDDVLPAFIDFASGGALAAHDAWFDLAFLEPDLAQLGLPPLAGHHPVLDPRLLAAIVHGPALTDLDTLARRLGLTIAGRHSALGDALGAAEILVRLLPALHDRGVDTLGAALAASRGLRPAAAR